MTKRPAFLAALPAALLAVGAGACTPASKVAEPDIVMKSPVAPGALSRCLAVELGQNFRDQRPTVDIYRGVHEITIDSPRGEKLAFVTVAPDFAGGSKVRFWNGDLYWPDHRISGVWPDVLRDNWHRFEAAENACQAQPVAAKPVAKAAPTTHPDPQPTTKPTSVKPVTKAQPLKPLIITPPAAAASATPSATTTTPSPATTMTPAIKAPAEGTGDPALLGS